jgi:hypothetical protein
MSSEVPQFTVNIICPKCSALGVVVWEKDGAQRSLVSLSKGFYERLSKEDPYPIELVCHECGAAQAEGDCL